MTMRRRQDGPHENVSELLRTTLEERAASYPGRAVDAGALMKAAHRRRRRWAVGGAVGAVAASAVVAVAVGTLGQGSAQPSPARSTTTGGVTATDESFLWARTLPDGPPAVERRDPVSPEARRTTTGGVQLKTTAGWVSMPADVRQLASPRLVRGGWVFRAGPTADGDAASTPAQTGPQGDASAGETVLTSVLFVSLSGEVRTLDTSAWVGDLIVDPTATRVAWTGGTSVSPFRHDVLRVVSVSTGEGRSIESTPEGRGRLATWGVEGITFVRLDGEQGVDADGRLSAGGPDSAPLKVLEPDGDRPRWHETGEGLRISGLVRAADTGGPAGRAVLDVRSAGGQVCARVLETGIVRDGALACAPNLWHDFTDGAYEMLVGQAWSAGKAGPYDTRVISVKDGSERYLPPQLRNLPASDLRWESGDVLVARVTRTRGQESTGVRWRVSVRTGQHISDPASVDGSTEITWPPLRP